MGKIVVVEGSHCSGKSTTIKELCKRTGFFESKSVPQWFRMYIPYARGMDSDNQLKIYEIGHKAAYYEATQSQEDYIFDRFIYTTIIRLNYDDGISVQETVKQILSFDIHPDVTIILHANLDVIKKRRLERDGTLDFDTKFYQYENEVFEILQKYERFVIIDNEIDINNTVDNILDVLKNKQIVEERKRLIK